MKRRRRIGPGWRWGNRRVGWFSFGPFLGSILEGLNFCRGVGVPAKYGPSAGEFAGGSFWL
jgi:hypothetical protein